jgi:hypothetical protein
MVNAEYLNDNVEAFLTGLQVRLADLKKLLAISGIGAKLPEVKSFCKNCSQGAGFSP